MAVSAGPPAPLLPLSELFAQLTSGIFCKNFAGIKPVGGYGALKNGRELPGKIAHMRAAPAPKSVALGDFREDENLLDAPVAIGGDHDHARARFHDKVVVKLPLRPMGTEVVSSELGFELLEGGT